MCDVSPLSGLGQGWCGPLVYRSCVVWDGSELVVFVPVFEFFLVLCSRGLLPLSGQDVFGMSGWFPFVGASFGDEDAWGRGWVGSGVLCELL